MPTFDDPEILHEEARALLREDNYAAAALTWAKSREAALTQSDSVAAFKAGVWEAYARYMSCEMRRSQDLVFLLLVAPPTDMPHYEWWILHRLCFDLQRFLRPDRTRLESLIADLEKLAARQVHPAGDLHNLRGNLESLRGNWDRSLDQHARGWQANDGSGIIRSMFAFSACKCCILLGRHAEAKSWWQHLSVTDQDEWVGSRRWLKEITLRLFLEASNHTAVRECVVSSCGVDLLDLRGRLFLRGESTNSIDDPADSAYPARRLAALKRTEDIHDRFDNLLALVDYRLACLRFTAGLAAVDDLYYRRPDVFPDSITLKDPEKFRHQLHLFGISWRLLDRLARRIDGWLECDWRTKEALSRRQRCDAIAAACAVSLSTQPTATT